VPEYLFIEHGTNNFDEELLNMCYQDCDPKFIDFMVPFCKKNTIVNAFNEINSSNYNLLLKIFIYVDRTMIEIPNIDTLLVFLFKGMSVEILDTLNNDSVVSLKNKIHDRKQYVSNILSPF